MTVPLILYATELDVIEVSVIELYVTEHCVTEHCVAELCVIELCVTELNVTELCVIELTHSSPGDSTADLLYQHDHDGGPPYPDHPDYPGYPGDQPGYLVDHPGYQAYMGEFRDEIEFNEYYQQVGRVRTFIMDISLENYLLFSNCSIIAKSYKQLILMTSLKYIASILLSIAQQNELYLFLYCIYNVTKLDIYSSSVLPVHRSRQSSEPRRGRGRGNHVRGRRRPSDEWGVQTPSYPSTWPPSTTRLPS